MIIDATDHGVVASTDTDQGPALQAAADAAYAADPRATLYIPAGEYRTDTTVTIRCNLDATGAFLRYHGTGTAMVLGHQTEVIFDLVFKLPSIQRITALWNGVSVGVEAVNLNSCTIITRAIAWFETGLLCVGKGQGFAYNQIHVGFLNHNHRNLVLTQADGGWTNQNQFYGGRYQIGASGTLGDVDAHHVLMLWDGGQWSGPNGNTWVGASFEGGDQSFYKVKMVKARYNEFYGCRWEHTGGSPGARILSLDGSVYNQVHRGYEAGDIITEADATSHHISVDDEKGAHVRALSATAMQVPYGGMHRVTGWAGLSRHRVAHTDGAFTPDSGRWLITARITFAPNPVGVRKAHIVTSSGVTLAMTEGSAGGQRDTVTVSVVHTFTGREQVWIEVGQLSGAPLATVADAGRCTLTMDKIAA